jgi:hypothetical protein
MPDRFISAVTSQVKYDDNGTVKAILIIIYHTRVPYSDVSYSSRSVNMTANLFAKEIQYLHDNGYKVLTMKYLNYDESINYLYIKGHR